MVHLKQYLTCTKARIDIFAYIEAFYNSVRPHSALGWLSPARFETARYTSAA
ncbi:MAG: transposase [Oscillospiraceae bacterium]|nr:transposase [Oscillospiraceae bacterium]